MKIRPEKVGPCPNSKKDLKKLIIPKYDKRRQSAGTHPKLVIGRQPWEKTWRQAFKGVQENFTKAEKKNKRQILTETKKCTYPGWNTIE
jgi:hypothetical protein